jgi:hypothetical protein
MPAPTGQTVPGSPSRRVEVSREGEGIRTPVPIPVCRRFPIELPVRAHRPRAPGERLPGFLRQRHGEEFRQRGRIGAGMQGRATFRTRSRGTDLPASSISPSPTSSRTALPHPASPAASVLPLPLRPSKHSRDALSHPVSCPPPLPANDSTSPPSLVRPCLAYPSKTPRQSRTGSPSRRPRTWPSRIGLPASPSTSACPSKD